MWQKGRQQWNPNTAEGGPPVSWIQLRERESGAAQSPDHSLALGEDRETETHTLVATSFTTHCSSSRQPSELPVNYFCLLNCSQGVRKEGEKGLHLTAVVGDRLLGSEQSLLVPAGDHSGDDMSHTRQQCE
jgi:hypothetical protein